jgi:aspartate aminotransferase
MYAHGGRDVAGFPAWVVSLPVILSRYTLEGTKMRTEDVVDSATGRTTGGPVADHIQNYFSSGSAIRRMFVEGLRLKAIHGADHVADLSIGNPVFPPPAAFDEALVSVGAEPGFHAYMPNAGYPWVREKVASNLNRDGYFEDISADHIVMTSGAAGALNVVLATILEPDDEVIVSRPFFVEYRFYVEMHGGIFRPVNCSPSLEISPDEIERSITPRTKAIILNSPNNPTGKVYRRDTLEQLSEMLLRIERQSGQRIYLISDEPYRELLFRTEPFVSPASLYPHSFMCYSWSKAFSIPGERIGYIAVNPSMPVPDWSLLIGSLGMCNRILGFVNAPAFMQRVIGASLDAPVDIRHYRTKRDILCETLEDAGYVFPRPEGAFYIFPRTPEPEEDFVDRAKRKLLLVVPGTDFGMGGHFRLCFAVPDATVELACRKLVEIKREIDES